MLNLKNPAYRTRPPAICRRPLVISLSRFPSLRNGTLRTAPQKTPLAKGQTAFLPPRSPVRLLQDFSALILSRFACSRRAASLRLGFKTKSASQSFGFSPSLQSIRPAHNGSALPSYFRLKKASLPRYCATSSSSPSMRSSWLYLATRSVRLGAPVLIWPALVATTMSAMVVSSVSPER